MARGTKAHLKGRDMELATDQSDQRGGRQFPPNSVRFYRRLKGLTMEEVAEKVGTKYQTIGKLEKGVMELTPDWAKKIGEAMDVVPGDLGYPSYEAWATKPIPVVGRIGTGLRIEEFDVPGSPIA